ncbi:MAG: hemolysin family protein [Actinomycetota bacterium]|nr:hemolysin family protein [Actinomycetota bacterium]MDQ3575218.1 hemolysin family protein [Actinomycetota bacterium]
MGSDLVLYIVILGALVVACVLAMAETSLTRMNRVKAMTMEEEGRRSAQKLSRLVEHPERFLNPILLLTLGAHLAIAYAVTILVERRFGTGAAAIATVGEAAVIFVVAEAAPKTWAVQHPERSALFTAPLVAPIVRFLPIRLLSQGLITMSNAIIPGKGPKEGPFVSEEELLAMADAAVDDDVIEREERALIHGIIRFGDTVVREVMVPRPDMIAVEASAKTSKVMERALEVGYSRLPVYDDGIDDVAGVVFVKDLVKAEREGKADQEVRTLVREAHFVPETKRANEMMKEMQVQQFHMAIVVDEYGGTAGLVTLEDLIEELVGEIVDEFDVEQKVIEPLSNGDYRVDARMPIDELNDLLHAELPTGDWDTVGGLVFNLLGHVPAEGEGVDADGHRLIAEKVQRRRIGRVRVAKLHASSPDENEAGAT